MRLQLLLLAFTLGCSARSPRSLEDAAAPAASASSSASARPPRATPVERVCADPTCGGPLAVVQAWHDAKGVLVRWEIVSSPRCPHLAGLFYDGDGQNPVLLPLPFFPPGKPSERQAVRAMHDQQIRGLTAGERVGCAP